ncbi:U6 snRNA phosphodiesterase, partial [Lecanoromycetidae sp. Uapishka_2]
MPLVEYSDSESSESSTPEKIQKNGIGQQGVKKKRRSDLTLPPLPDAFHDLYAATSRVSNQDEPTLHSGRQRIIPHVEGNWPTHIYIEYQRQAFTDTLTKALNKANVQPIAWALSAPAQGSEDNLSKASHDFFFQALKIEINAVKIKIGNSISSVPLESKLDTSNRIIGT